MADSLHLPLSQRLNKIVVVKSATKNQIMKNSILLIITVCFAFAAQGQQLSNTLRATANSKTSTPIPVEVFAGKNALAFQMIVNKRLSPNSRFGFFNVTHFVGDYKSTGHRNQYLSQLYLTTQFWKGFSLNTGVVMHFMTGFRPTAGVQYTFASKNFLAVMFPRFDLSQTYNFETLALAEYKPKFKNNWGLYARVQALYNQDSKFGLHDRSYLWLRAGPSYKNYKFGVGFNVDYYGPLKTNENNFVLFAIADLW